MADRKTPAEIRIDALKIEVWDRTFDKEVTGQVETALGGMLGKAGKVVTGKPKSGFLVSASGSVDYDEERGEAAVELRLLVKRHDNRLVGNYKAKGAIKVKDAARLETSLGKLIGLVADKLGKEVLPDLEE